MLNKTKTLLLGVAFSGVIGQIIHAADRTPSRIADAVLSELGEDIAPQDKPGVRRFAILTVKSMKNVHRPWGTRSMVIRSVTEVVRGMKEDNEQLVGKRLERSLAQFLNRRRDNLAKVTDAMLARNWKALRKTHVENAKRLGKRLNDYFARRPVVIVDMGLLFRISKLRQTGDRRPPESDAKARKDFLSIVQHATERRLVENAGYIDSVYYMATLRHLRSLSKLDVDRFESFLKKRFAVDGVIVLGANEMYSAFEGADMFLLTGKLPAPPGEETRFQRLRANYRLLSILRRTAKSPPPGPIAVFGGKVPANILDGSRFGFSRAARRRVTAEDIRRRADLQQRVMIWSASLAQCVHLKDNLASGLLMKYLTVWADKVLTLKEFLGNKDAKDVSFSPLQDDLLKLLRRARTELPLFTKPIETDDAGEAGRTRNGLSHQWRSFIVLGNVPAGWEDVDRGPYLAIVPKLQEWEDAAYKEKITPKISRMNQLQSRASRLFLELRAHVNAKHIRARGGRSGAIVYYAFDKNIVADGYLDFIAEGKEPPPDKLKQLNYIELALFRYLQVAVRHNPMFRDLDRVVPRAEIEKRFKTYLKDGRAPEEQQAYEKAFRALEVATGVVNPKPGEKFSSAPVRPRHEGVPVADRAEREPAAPHAETAAARPSPLSSSPPSSPRNDSGTNWTLILSAVGVVVALLLGGLLFLRTRPGWSKT